MKTLRRLILAALAAIALVTTIHCILSTRAYVRALSDAQITVHPVYSSTIRGTPNAPRTLGQLSDQVIPFDQQRPFERVRHEDPTMYQYRVTVRHWTIPEKIYDSQTFLVFDLWTDRRIVVTAEGTQPIALGYPVPDTPKGLGRAVASQLTTGDPTTVVSTGGNYGGWIARDLMWIKGGGWLLYACAALVGAGIQFRGILWRGVGVVEHGAMVGKRGVVSGVQFGRALAEKIDEKIEALNAPKR